MRKANFDPVNKVVLFFSIKFLIPFFVLETRERNQSQETHRVNQKLFNVDWLHEELSYFLSKYYFGFEKTFKIFLTKTNRLIFRTYLKHHLWNQHLSIGRFLIKMLGIAYSLLANCRLSKTKLKSRTRIRFCMSFVIFQILFLHLDTVDSEQNQENCSDQKLPQAHLNLI